MKQLALRFFASQHCSDYVPLSMSTTPKPFDAEAPSGSMRAIIRYDPANGHEKEMVEAAWGSDPRFSAGISFRFVRSEGRAFPSHRCLIPASEFQMAAGGQAPPRYARRRRSFLPRCGLGTRDGRLATGFQGHHRRRQSGGCALPGTKWRDHPASRRDALVRRDDTEVGLLARPPAGILNLSRRSASDAEGLSAPTQAT